MTWFDLVLYCLGFAILGGLFTYPIAYLKGRQYQIERFGRLSKNAKAKI